VSFLGLSNDKLTEANRNTNGPLMVAKTILE